MHISAARNRTRRAFSFLEIMLVVAIIGILVAIVGPKLAGRSGKAKETATRQQMDAIETALGLFEIDTGSYPSSEQGLEALVDRPSDIDEDVWAGYMKKMPKDGWGNEFVYRYPGESGEDYDLVSAGQDKKIGTDDDITNFEGEDEDSF